MAARRHDKAIAALLKWAEHEEWRDRFGTIILEHLGPIYEEFNLNPEDVIMIVGEENYAEIFVCIFEDFLACRFEPDGANIVDDYLKRRGWKEPAPIRRYLETLSKSVMSLYEVVDCVPGHHLMVRDLIRGGDPIQVDDKAMSREVAQWDQLAARLLTIGDKTVMSDGVLWLSFAEADVLKEHLAKTKKDINRSLKRSSKRGDIEPAALEDLPVDDLILGEMAPLFTQTKLFPMLNIAPGGSLPKLLNADGEELVLCQTWFPILDTSQESTIQNRLDAAEWLSRDDPGLPAWTWLTPEPASGGPQVQPPLRPGEQRLLGTVNLGPDTVYLETNSMERAERGITLLADVLGTLVGPPEMETETPEETLESLNALVPQENSSEELMPPEEMAAVLHEVMDKHYQALLSQPVPMLDGKTPKQAAGSKAGRQKLVEWLKFLENDETHRAAAMEMPPYDFTWMWEALKITDLRK